MKRGLLFTFLALAGILASLSGVVSPALSNSPNPVPQNYVFLPVIAKLPDIGETLDVSAGSFQMGCDSKHNGGYECEPNELPPHTVN